MRQQFSMIQPRIRSRWPLAVCVLAGTFLCATALLPRAARADARSGETTLYVGGYTRNAGDGLVAMRFDSRTGVLSDLRLVAPISNPDWLELSRDGKTLYAGGTLDNKGDGKTGLTAFAVQKDGALRAISSQTDSDNPVSLAVDATGKWLVGAYYGAGNWAIWPLDADGKIGARQQLIQHKGSGPNTGRQGEPHAHQAMISPDNKRIWIVDLGIDKAMVYDVDARSGAIKPSHPAFAAVAPGSGPRHLAFGKNGQFVYIISELANTISVFQGGRGAPGAIQTISTLPSDFKANSYGAEIVVSPDGKTVLASNRGYDSIARFAVQNDGTLQRLGWTKVGKEPRHFTFDPTGQWVLVGNQKERSISVFAFDAKSGALKFSSEIKGVLNDPTRLVFGR